MNKKEKFTIQQLVVGDKLEPGDKVICLLGFNKNQSSSLYGGAGYEENCIFTVRRNTSFNNPNSVVWIVETLGVGIFIKALAKVRCLSEIEICIELIREELV